MKLKYLSYVLLALATGALAAAIDTNDNCRQPYKFDTTILAETDYVATELAVTSDQKRNGLSGRSCIDRQHGMLFAFGKAGYHSIWMKDMHFPVDIVWLTEDQVVSDIKANVSPETYPSTFTNQIPGKYVLELPAGRAAELAIEPGKALKF